MSTIVNSSPVAEAPAQADEPALLTLTLDGRGTFNRQAARVLPARITELQLAQPQTLGAHWLLLPGLTGGLKVRGRADRLGYLRIKAATLAAHAFAAHPPGTVRVYLQLVPVAEGWFALHFFGADV